MNTSRRANPDFGKTPVWFKLWFAFCAVVGLALLGVLVWAIITLVSWVTR